jgi:hypothetical protein
VSDWIARVMPLPLPVPAMADSSAVEELVRFRIRIASPHHRAGTRLSVDRWATMDVGPVRILALDSWNPCGGVGGSLDSDQAAWLVRQLQGARDRYVIVASHDSSLTMTSDRVPPGRPPRVLGAEVCSLLLAHSSVIAWISGTMHHRAGRRHGEGGHGFWELPGTPEGRGAPLAGGLSISVRRDRPVMVMRGALAMSVASAWELRDPLADDLARPAALTAPGVAPR